jgi:hypothetical protein
MRATTELIGPARRIPSTRSAACRVLSDGGLLPRCFQLATSELVDKSAGLYSGNPDVFWTSRRKTHQDRCIGNSSYEVLLRGSCSSEEAQHRLPYARFLYLCWHCNWNTSATKVAFQEAHLKSARSRRQHVELLISLRSGRRAGQGGDEKTAAWCVHAVL